METDTGPTGHIRGDCHIARVSRYGYRHLGGDSNTVSLLNKDVTQCRQVVLDQFQAATYLHVDDLLCISISCSLTVHANHLMSSIADALQAVGFIVPTDSRQTDEDLDKTIGYTIWRGEGRFTVTVKKWVLLHGSPMNHLLNWPKLLV